MGRVTASCGKVTIQQDPCSSWVSQYLRKSAGWIPVCFVFLKVGHKRSLTSLFTKQDAIESQDYRFVEAGKDL